MRPTSAAVRRVHCRPKSFSNTCAAVLQEAHMLTCRAAGDHVVIFAVEGSGDTIDSFPILLRGKRRNNRRLHKQPTATYISSRRVLCNFRTPRTLGFVHSTGIPPYPLLVSRSLLLGVNARDDTAAWVCVVNRLERDASHGLNERDPALPA